MARKKLDFNMKVIDECLPVSHNSAMLVCIQRAYKLALMLLLGFAALAKAGPGDGLTLRSWVLSPSLDLNLSYDSNVYKDLTNHVDDIYFEPELGLRFSSSRDTNNFSIRGNLFYSDRQYETEENRDFKTYGDSVNLELGNGRKSLIELIQSYRFIDDNDRHAADLESSSLSAEMVQDSNTLDLERTVNQLGASVSRRVTDKLELGLSYRYSGVDYDNTNHYRLDPKDLDVPYGLDLDGHIFQLDGSLGLTDKTDALLTLRQGLQYQEYTDGSAQLTTLRLGLKTQSAEKLIYNVGAGLEYYARPFETTFEDADIDENDVDVDEEGVHTDNSQIAFNFSASIDWFMTEKLTFRCGGFNGTQFSSFYVGNGLEYISGWAGLGYRWKPSTILSVRGVYRDDDYLDPVTHEGETKDRHDQRIEGHARADYMAPGSFLRFYLEGTYDEVKSNFDFVEYVDQRLIVGAIIRY